jgi:hypothetical protein
MAARVGSAAYWQPPEDVPTDTIPSSGSSRRHQSWQGKASGALSKHLQIQSRFHTTRRPLMRANFGKSMTTAIIIFNAGNTALTANKANGDQGHNYGSASPWTQVQRGRDMGSLRPESKG